jgi:hypothetical protein
MEEDLKDLGTENDQEFENDQPHRMELLKRFFKIFLIYLTRWADGHMESLEQSRETELVKVLWNCSTGISKKRKW